MSVAHRLTLDYTLAPGWLAPYADALLEGRAMARRCACGHTSFPPLRTCPACGGTHATWHPLPGTARLLHRTTGSDGDHTLARLDGANTACVARLKGVSIDAEHATLIAPDRPLPQLILGPLTDKDRA